MLQDPLAFSLPPTIQTAARAGFGLAYLPKAMVRDDVQAGDLIEGGPSGSAQLRIRLTDD